MANNYGRLHQKMRTIPNLRFRIVCGRTPTQRAPPSTRPKRAPTRFAAHANGRHCSRRARSAHATPISEIIEMNGTFHRTMSPAPTGPTPAPRASPVARRLRLGDDVSAFCDSIGITRRIVAHLPRPFLLPPQPLSSWRSSSPSWRSPPPTRPRCRAPWAAAISTPPTAPTPPPRRLSRTKLLQRGVGDERAVDAPHEVGKDEEHDRARRMSHDLAEAEGGAKEE